MLEFDVGSSQFYPAKEVEAMLSGAPATLASIALRKGRGDPRRFSADAEQGCGRMAQRGQRAALLDGLAPLARERNARQADGRCAAGQDRVDCGAARHARTRRPLPHGCVAAPVKSRR